MTPDPRIEVAAEALVRRRLGAAYRPGLAADYLADAAAVVAALDAHDAGLRERLAQAVEALAPAAPPFLAHEATRHIQTRRGAMLDAARIVRDTP